MNDRLGAAFTLGGDYKGYACEAKVIPLSNGRYAVTSSVAYWDGRDRIEVGVLARNAFNSEREATDAIVARAASAIDQRTNAT